MHAPQKLAPVEHGPIRHNIRFPKEALHASGQDEAYFYLLEGGEEVRLRFHDYAEIYERPGLYEQLFYDRLQCDSPRRIADILANAVSEADEPVEALRVLDLGAGNGISGEEMKRHNASRIVAADIIGAARDAAVRDRPGVYDDYVVADMTRLGEEQERSLKDWRFTALTTIAALGFDDIPARAFLNAVNLIDDRGWLAFTIRTDFLAEGDASGFAMLIKRLLYGNLVDLHHMERYRHRLSIDGEAIYYFAVVVRKKGPLDENLLEG